MTHGISSENKLNIDITLRILGITVQSSYPKYLQDPKGNKQTRHANSNRTR
jgi:hypothetical protein